MTKIDIFSGFLGAGKTTLIKKLIAEAFRGEKLVLIENEFGEIAIDGGFLQDAGIEITEMNSGCICCSLVGDFGKALQQVLAQFHPDRILIEPSGVGKLSDVIRAVQNLHMEDVVLNSFTTVADANKCKMYMKNFGEFYNDQIEHANSIILSRTAGLAQKKLDDCVALLRAHNETATIITTPWDALSGAQILEAMEHRNTLDAELKQLEAEAHEHHHHDHDGCSCGHHHTQEELDAIHAELGCEGACGSCDLCDTCLHSTVHHHHDADEVFTSWGRETPRKYSREELQDALASLAMSEDYGYILRAKGMVPCDDGQTWLHFDLVPEEFQIREGSPDYTGRLCVIGSDLKEDQLEKLFLLV